MGLHILYPDARGEEQEMKKELREWIALMMEEFRKRNQWYAWCKLAMALQVIYPEVIGDLRIDNEAFESIKKNLEERRGEPHVFIPMLGIVKFLFPEKAKDIPLRSQDWEIFMDQMQWNRKIPSTYIDNACAAVMASAERYEILSDGNIRITPRQRALSKSAPLPQRSHTA